MYTIAVDAMGGDAAPRVEVEGAILAARAYAVKVLLVGRQEVLRRELAEHLADHLPIEIVKDDIFDLQLVLCACHALTRSNRARSSSSTSRGSARPLTSPITRFIIRPSALDPFP